MWCTSSNSRIVTSWPAHSSIKLLLVVVQSLPLSSPSTFLYLAKCFRFLTSPNLPTSVFSIFHCALSHHAFPLLNRSTLLLHILFPLLSSSYLPLFPFTPPSLMLSTVAQLHSLSPISTAVFSSPCPFYSFATLSNRFLSTFPRLSLVHPLLSSHILSTFTPP